MREFIYCGNWEYGELQVKEKNTGKSFTVTEPKLLFSEDYYRIRRGVAIDNCPVDAIPEKDFYVYQISYLTGNGSLTIKIIDHITAHSLISQHLDWFMQGRALSAIDDFFEGR